MEGKNIFPIKYEKFTSNKDKNNIFILIYSFLTFEFGFYFLPCCFYCIFFTVMFMPVPLNNQSIAKIIFHFF